MTETSIFELLIYLVVTVSVVTASKGLKMIWGYTLSILKIGVVIGGSVAVAVIVYLSHI